MVERIVTLAVAGKPDADGHDARGEGRRGKAWGGASGFAAQMVGIG